MHTGLVVHAAATQDHDGANQAPVCIKEHFSCLEYLGVGGVYSGAYVGELIDWALGTPRDHSGNRQAAGTNQYTRQRFPAELISPSLWLRCHSYLSYHNIEEPTLEHSVIVTDEAISQMVPEAWTIRCPSVVPPVS